jgi:hypothetical protein
MQNDSRRLTEQKIAFCHHLSFIISSKDSNQNDQCYSEGHANKHLEVVITPFQLCLARLGLSASVVATSLAAMDDLELI